MTCAPYETPLPDADGFACDSGEDACDTDDVMSDVDDTEVESGGEEGEIVPYALRLARLLSHSAANDGLSVGPAVCNRCRFWHRQGRDCPAVKACYFYVTAANTAEERTSIAVSGADYVLCGSPDDVSLLCLMFFPTPVTAIAVERYFAPALVLVTKCYSQDAVNFALEEVLSSDPYTLVEMGVRPLYVQASPSMRDRLVFPMYNHPQYKAQ